MQALWISFKESVNCRSKLTDVNIHPHKCSEKRSCNSGKEHLDGNLIHRRRNLFGQVIISGYQTQTQFCQLNIGDPARNIAVLIFRGASTNPSKPSWKIKRVLKVKNSAENLQRFERQREMVKKNASKQHKGYPRISVDGNELLRFYGTTMSCCGSKSKRVSELCRDPTCCVCRIIQSNFDTEYTKKYGILLSTNSEELSDNMIAFSKSKKMDRAVILCRIIAGTIINKVEQQHEELHSKSEPLILRNPCAVLPCFVIVFS